MEKKSQESLKNNDDCPCPFGMPFNRVVICSAPIEETGVRQEWSTSDCTGYVVTRQFCSLRCKKADVPKPFMHNH